MAAPAAAAALILRGGTTCRLRLPLFSATTQRSRFFHAVAGACSPREGSTATSTPNATVEFDASGGQSQDSSEKMASLCGDLLENKRYREEEASILKDIEPIRELTKKILHSERYRDGECLNDDDEKAVVENLLVYHPHSEDKIGCGIDSIMVL
uniref:DNA-directed RNA polymerase E subunit 1 n=1 Tax=Anthurium amnicola TaxID=1678845 RepID=A0A1D1Y4J8_9ARAE